MPGIDEAQIWDVVNQAWPDMSPTEKHFWELIRINPERWTAEPYRYRPRMAWVVAIMGRHVIWYNECWLGDELDGMDTGFACARYAVRGQIGPTFSLGADSLKNAVRVMLNQVHST